MPPTPARARRLRILQPLKNPDFALLWVGMTVSLLGDGIFLVALPFQVFELSNLPTALAIVGAVWTTPHVLFLPLGGVVSDRFDRRLVMIASDVMRGAAIGVVGLLSVTGAACAPSRWRGRRW